MIQINLLPVREARRKADLRQQGMQLALVLLLVFGGIGFVHSRMNERLAISQDRVRQMKSDIDNFKPQLDKVAEFREKKADLEKKIDIIDGLDRARKGPVRMMDELAMRVPERVWLQSLSTTGTSLKLRGASLDNERVAAFLGALGSSDYFDEVDLGKTELGSSGDGLRIVKFDIDARLVTPRDGDS